MSAANCAQNTRTDLRANNYRQLTFDLSLTFPLYIFFVKLRVR